MKCVVFDVGNVLVRWDPFNLYRQMGYSEGEMQAIMADIGLPELNHRKLDAGAEFGPVIAQLASSFPEHKDFILAFHERWSDMLGGAIEANVAVLRDLKAKGVPVYGLSNFNREKFDIARAKFSFLDEFDGLVVSGDIGLVKPDREIYDYLIDKCGLDATQSLFIDDSAANIEAAKVLGFKTVWYREGEVDLAAEIVDRR